MTIIKLVDARRGLNLKCRELFKSERIAEEIYRYLCDGIEECDNVEPERKKGEWIIEDTLNMKVSCGSCGFVLEDWIQGAFYRYCPNCGAWMGGEKE